MWATADESHEPHADATIEALDLEGDAAWWAAYRKRVEETAEGFR